MEMKNTEHCVDIQEKNVQNCVLFLFGCALSSLWSLLDFSGLNEMQQTGRQTN